MLERHNDLIRISVTDDGHGFACAMHGGLPVVEKGGFGLFNTIQKMELIGGSFSIVSNPGQGATCILEAHIDN